MAFVLLPSTRPAIAPIAAPPTTFFTSALLGSLRTRATSAWLTLASTEYVLPPNSTLFTANSMTIGSFMFSLRFSRVTVRFSVAPAGIVAPFEPTTASVTVAER